MKNRFFFAMLTVVLALLSACASGVPEEHNAGIRETASSESGVSETDRRANEDASESDAGRSVELSDIRSVTLRFDYRESHTQASNLFAVYVINQDGKLVKTLFLPNFIGQRRYYERRPDAISRWVALANPSLMDDSELDAISGATPDGGSLSYTWDLTDENGGAVEKGVYRMILEATLYWDSETVFTAEIDLSHPEQPVTVREERTRSDVDTNADMIANVTVTVD